jgi:hypothetical protein
MFTHRTLPTEKHRETFAQKKNTHIFFYKLHTQTAQKKIHPKIFARRNFTQNSFYTAETFPHRSLYEHFFFTAPQFLQRVFLHRKFSAQKVLRTTFFTYRRLYTQMMPLHGKRIAHKTCAHSTLLHATSFYTERFCFPFLIIYLSCSPSQIVFCKKQAVVVDILYGYHCALTF